LSALKKLFKQTFIYGLATVLPRMLSFLLVPLYTSVLAVKIYGKVSVIFAWFAIFNVFLAYGMETAFFRFFNKEDDKKSVINTSAISLIVTSFLFFSVAFLFQNQIAYLTQIETKHIRLVIWILLLDALVIIPFAWLRATERPVKYSIIKITNVIINLSLNLFFLLWLKDLANGYSFFKTIYISNFEISYIFIANIIASGVTLLMLAPFYIKMNYQFNRSLWKKMIQYAIPVLIAGIAYSINETFDKVLLGYLLPKNIADTQIGMYSACYKLAVFMTLFATAFRLGIEPFFFSHAKKSKNPEKNYALILEFFVAFGAIILLGVIVFADFLKPLIIRNESYWEAMWVVPLILLANFCLGIYHNLSVWYKVTDKTKYGAYFSVIGAIITLVLNFILIPIIGYKGSAIATLSAYASMLIISYYVGKKHYPIPYNITKIVSYLGISIVFSILSFYYFRGNYYVGILLFVSFVIFVFFQEKKQLVQLLKK